ncbi:MAG: hypothetical protein NVSMB62_23230 [Acidobacteriaceae bacterium]
MPQPFDELRECLLRAGIAPRHVRRYLRELSDHLNDLHAEEHRAGRNHTDAEAAAFARLGTIDALLHAMTAQPQLRAWSVRAPWLTFGLAPLLTLAVTYSVALLLLWSGWRIFLPEAITPFVRSHGFAAVYFGLGRMLYFGAPLFIGWAASAAAVRQRLSTAGPVLATLCVASTAAAARVHAVRLNGTEHVGLSFAIGRMLPSGPAAADPLAWCFSGVLSYTLLILTLAMLPCVLWRLRSICAA